jgi:regulator of sigma E protease
MGWINLIFWLAGTFITVLAPMILIHELGHFITAKLAGVHVEEFGLGYPPRLLKLWRGKGSLAIDGTRVTIPGDVNLPADLKPDAHVRARVERTADGTPALREIHVMNPDLLPPGEDDDHVSGRVTALERGTVYSFNLLPLGGFVRMRGEEDPSDPRSLAAQPKRQRAAVIASGAILNILIAVVLLTMAFVTGVPQEWWSQISTVVPGTPAATSGLQVGDVVVAADGQSMASEVPNVTLIEYTRDHLGEPITLTVRRNGSLKEITTTPREEWPADQGPIGIALQHVPRRENIRKYGLFAGVRETFQQIGTILWSIVSLPGRAASGTADPLETRPVSIVVILEILALALKNSVDWNLWYPILQEAGIISLAIGLTNLLPIPGLDGGRLLAILIEAIRGRRIAPEKEAIVHLVGMLILVTLMLTIIVYDFANPLISWTALKEWLR